MAVFAKSRYATAKIYDVPDSQRKQIDGRIFLILDDFSNWDIIVVDENDRIDLLAHTFYGSAALWWVIADVNNIAFPLEIERDQKLFIPDPGEVRVILQGLGVM